MFPIPKPRRGYTSKDGFTLVEMLAVIGVLNSAVSFYYYLRVMVYMYFRDPAEDYAWVSLPATVVISIVVAVIGVFYLGIVPGEVMELAKLAVF